MAAYQSSYECDNAQRYATACNEAAAASLKDRGCAVHVCAVIGMRNGAPVITHYKLSDWFDDATVATYVNGNNTR